MNIIFLDTSLLQISHLGIDTVNRWHFVLESGRWGRSRCILPSPLHLYLSLLPLFLLFFGGDYCPTLSACKPFLIFLSVINLYLTDSILLYPAHIFFHLPPCLLPSYISLSLSLSYRMLKIQWAGYKNMNSTSEKESVIYPFRPTGCVLIFQKPLSAIVWFQQHTAVTLLRCKKLKGHRAVKSCVIFSEV